MEKGPALETVPAFKMAVIGLSLLEMITLRRVLKPQLIAVFVALVGAGNIATSYLGPERTFGTPGGKRESVGNVLAALLGNVTPSARARPYHSSSASSSLGSHLE